MAMTTEELVDGLHQELKSAPPIVLRFDAPTALRICGLLQLALRHPQIGAEDKELVMDLANQLTAIGPAFAQIVEAGFDPKYDR